MGPPPAPCINQKQSSKHHRLPKGIVVVYIRMKTTFPRRENSPLLCSNATLIRLEVIARWWLPNLGVPTLGRCRTLLVYRPHPVGIGRQTRRHRHTPKGWTIHQFPHTLTTRLALPDSWSVPWRIWSSCWRDVPSSTRPWWSPWLPPSLLRLAFGCRRSIAPPICRPISLDLGFRSLGFSHPTLCTELCPVEHHGPRSWGIVRLSNLLQLLLV